MTRSRIALTTAAIGVVLGIGLAFATRAAAESAPAPREGSVVGTVVPAARRPVEPVVAPNVTDAPVSTGDRTVILDSKDLVSEFDSRTRTVSDMDAETGETIRDINSRPGTYQTYLLATHESHPFPLFHPGFAIRFRPRAVVPPSDAVAPEGLPPMTAPELAAPPAPASR